MKKSLVLLVLLFSGMIHGAQLAWGFWGDSVVSGSPVLAEGSVAYLLQTDVDLGLVKDHLSTYGINATSDQKSNFKLIAQESDLSGSFEDGMVSIGSTGDWASADELKNLFVLVLDADGNFYISNILADATKNQMVGADYLYNSEISDGISLGTEPLPGAPEPTVLALLALGVAGLTLKRRVA